MKVTVERNGEYGPNRKPSGWVVKVDGVAVAVYATRAGAQMGAELRREGVI